MTIRITLSRGPPIQAPWYRTCRICAYHAQQPQSCIPQYVFFTTRPSKHDIDQAALINQARVFPRVDPELWMCDTYRRIGQSGIYVAQSSLTGKRTEEGDLVIRPGADTTMYFQHKSARLSNSCHCDNSPSHDFEVLERYHGSESARLLLLTSAPWIGENLRPTHCDSPRFGCKP